jgi:hypothetical protein
MSNYAHHIHRMSDARITRGPTNTFRNGRTELSCEDRFSPLGWSGPRVVYYERNDSRVGVKLHFSKELRPITKAPVSVRTRYRRTFPSDIATSSTEIALALRWLTRLLRICRSLYIRERIQVRTWRVEVDNCDDQRSLAVQFCDVITFQSIASYCTLNSRFQSKLKAVSVSFGTIS